MRKFRFELGEIVNHASKERSGNKMIIIARYFEESKSGVEEKYLVSTTNMGEIRRHVLIADELIKSES